MKVDVGKFMKTRNQITGLIAALAVGAMALTGASAASADTGALTTGHATTVITNTANDGVATEEQDADGIQAVDPGGDSPDCVVCGAPVKKAVKVSGPVLQSKKFVRYLTGAWAKSTGYSWNSSTTVAATISTGLGVTAAGASSNIGVSASMTKSYSITVNIAASSSKYSKLGLASNYNRYYVKSAYHQNGKPVAGATWTFGYLYSPTKDQFLVVYYQ